MCRHHVPCSHPHEGKGSYWDRSSCAICTKAWESLTNPDMDAAVYALASLKTWVGGVSRNNKGPYLDSNVSRMVLFPKARPTAVVSYVPGPTK